MAISEKAGDMREKVGMDMANELTGAVSEREKLFDSTVSISHSVPDHILPLSRPSACLVYP